MYKVLICDDETDIRNALNIYLTAQGYETLLCALGDSAQKGKTEMTSAPLSDLALVIVEE